MKLKESFYIGFSVVCGWLIFFKVSCNQKNISPKIQGEPELFEKQSEINLTATESTLVSNLGHIAVFEDKLLIADEVGKQVVLFDTNGRFIKVVSRVGDYPGGISYNILGIVLENKSIYILDYSKVNMFNEKLDFVEALYIPYSIPEYSIINGQIFYLEKLDPYVDAEIRMIKNGNLKTIKRISLKFPRKSSRENNFMVRLKNDNLLVLIQREFLLFLTDEEGTFEKKNLTIPEDFIVPSEDFTGNFGSISDYKKYAEKNKISIVFECLTQNEFIFVFWLETQKGKMYLEIYDYQLNHILSEIPIKGDISLLKHCDGEYFYGLKMPKMKDVEDIVNPTLLKYRFRYEILDSLTKNLSTRNE